MAQQLRAQSKGFVPEEDRRRLRGSVQPRFQNRVHPDAGDLGKTRRGLHGRLQDGPLRLPVLPQQQRSYQVQYRADESPECGCGAQARMDSEAERYRAGVPA